MTRVISVRLNEDVLKKVEIISRRLKRSKNWVIGEVLENYLEEMYDVEEAKRILLDETDELIDHEQAKKELLSD
jgi:predicted transcriptional regulator